MRDFVNQFIMKQWICGTWRKQKCRRNLLFAFGKGDTNETDVRRQQYQEDGYEEQIKKMELLIEHLEDNDDVQNIYHNWDMPEEAEEE